MRSRSGCSPWMRMAPSCAATRRCENARLDLSRATDETWSEHFEPGAWVRLQRHGLGPVRRRTGNTRLRRRRGAVPALPGQGDAGRGHDRRIAAGHYPTLQGDGQTALPGGERFADRGAEPAWHRGGVRRGDAQPRQRPTAGAGLPRPGSVQADQRPVRPPRRGRGPETGVRPRARNAGRRARSSGGSAATSSSSYSATRRSARRPRSAAASSTGSEAARTR